MFAQAAQALLEHVTTVDYPEDPRPAVVIMARHVGIRPREPCRRSIALRADDPRFRTQFGVLLSGSELSDLGRRQTSCCRGRRRRRCRHLYRSGRRADQCTGNERAGRRPLVPASGTVFGMFFAYLDNKSVTPIVQFIDLCIYPHRLIYADPATVRRTSRRSD